MFSATSSFGIFRHLPSLPPPAWWLTLPSTGIPIMQDRQILPPRLWVPVTLPTVLIHPTVHYNSAVTLVRILILQTMVTLIFQAQIISRLLFSFFLMVTAPAG